MKTYIGCKIINAEPMTGEIFNQQENAGKSNFAGPGYKVIYPDGYVSRSPKKVFDGAYREVSRQERLIVHSTVSP